LDVLLRTKKKPGAILKDLDIKESSRKLHFDPDLGREFLKQLKKDCEFLAHHNVMDYSLLLGIYYETPENKEKTAQNLKRTAESKTIINTLYKSAFQQHYNGLRVTRPDGVTEVYYIGVIDVLVQYITKKKMESFVKSLAYAGEEVSVIQPTAYSRRFFHFMKNIVARPPGSEVSSSSEEADEEGEHVADLPEPGSGDVFRPPAAIEDKTERRSTVGVGGSSAVASGAASAGSGGSISVGKRSSNKERYSRSYGQTPLVLQQ